MAQRRFHYEQAFEHYLRANRIPYVAVDEAKKALMPAAERSARTPRGADGGAGARRGGPHHALKSFDFVVYAAHGNLLVDVKGRMFGTAQAKQATSNRRFESWVTQDDVDSLRRWQQLFGRDFEAVFVFAYCLRQQPPDALFDDLFAFGERWYALRQVRLIDYEREMVARSAKWQTVHVPGEAFSRISGPFSAAQPPAAVSACGPSAAGIC